MTQALKKKKKTGLGFFFSFFFYFIGLGYVKVLDYYLRSRLGRLGRLAGLPRGWSFFYRVFSAFLLACILFYFKVLSLNKNRG